MNRAGKILIPLSAFLIIIAMWQIGVSVFKPPKFLLPGPLDIMAGIKAFGVNWVKHIMFTVRATLMGFLVAIAFGVVVSVGIVHSKFINAALTPLLVVLQVIPKIAFAPLLLIWFGTGSVSIVIIAFIVSFFPVVVNTTIGLSEIEPELLDLTRCYHMSMFRVLVRIRFPNALPYFFSGVKVASTLAVIGAIIGEFVGSNQGLGYLVLIANNQMNTAMAMGSIFFISVFGLVLFGLTALIERICMPWRTETGQELVSLT